MVSLKMDQRYFKSWFSRHFNHLTYLGMWSTEILTNPTIRKIYIAYRTLLHFLIIIIVTSQMLDLYFVFDDFEKITFNFGTSSLVIGVLIKLIWVNGRSDCVDELRFGLWRDFLELESEEDLATLDWAHRQLNLMYYSGYSAFAITVFPVVFFSYYAYTLGSQELPFAAFLPIPYPNALTLETFCSVVVALLALENELVGFCLILQIIAHYEVLINRLKKVNEIYMIRDGVEEEKPTGGPDREAESRKKAKEIVKYCVKRHLQLMEYTNKLEFIYSRCMVIQLLLGSFLIVMNGLELLLFSHEFSLKLMSQMLIIVILVIDLLLVCHYNCKMTDQCINVGNAVYSTAWYRMDEDIKKGLYMIMIGSRKPPRVTAGKIILIDLHTYMQVLRNILSWLMLIRQLVKQEK